MAAFRLARDSICIAGSDDIAALNAMIEGSAPVDQAAILRQVVDRIEVAQHQLDELPVPAEIATFVGEDATRRADRIELMTRLADAVEAGGFTSADADAVDAELNELNILTEAEEDANRLAHCP
ncbi:MAG TPA: hypothetical protein VEW95_04705 [Candidatus Limnocylindrales bacterium]|nr:hypothetical protein [Candidatus Limnocylindrales bacterium]